MVSFSCEVCNDTVIKKKLDQHTRQCRGAYFSCIDCSTTFSGFDYRNHTQCISEAEKYEKSLFKGKKHQQVKKTAVEDKVTVAKLVIEEKKKPTLKKEKKKKEVTDLNKYYKEDESLYKIIKKISKDNKKTTKELLKSFKLVKDGENYVLKL